jgi:hypothetical protein
MLIGLIAIYFYLEKSLAKYDGNTLIFFGFNSSPLAAYNG